MPLTIQVGTILMKEWRGMPRLIGFETEPGWAEWSIVKVPDAFTLDRKIHAAGWNFFFMAAEMKVMFFGAIGAQGIQNALQRILRKVSHQNFNCLEVTGIVAKRFLGLPYATLSAHSRHIQQGRQLDDIERRRAAQRAAQG